MVKLYKIDENIFLMPDLKSVVKVNDAANEYLEDQQHLEEKPLLLSALQEDCEKICNKEQEVVLKNPSLSTKVQLVLTNHCNMSCKYCYSNSIRSKAKMAYSVAKKAIDHVIHVAYLRQMASHKKKNAVVHYHGGGEPTMEWVLFKNCTDYALRESQKHGVGLDLIVATNGMLSKEKLDYILENHFRIRISLDGLGEFHNHQRPCIDGQDSYQKVAETLDRIQQSDCEFVIGATITKHNVRHIPMFVEHVANRWGRLSGFRLVWMKPNEISRMQGLETADYHEYMRYKDLGIQIALHKGLSPDIFREYRIHQEEYILKEMPACIAVTSEMIVVDPLGRIVRCNEAPNDQGALYGYIDDTGVHFNKQFIKQQAKQLNDEWSTGACSHCFAKRYCYIKCYNPSQVDDEFCRYHRTLFRRIIKDLMHQNTYDRRFSVKHYRPEQMHLPAVLKRVSWG